MAGHFQAIGVEDPRRFIDQAVQLGHWHARQDGGDTIVWRDESGASLVVWVSAANEIVYASPSFDARSRIPVANAGVYENQECRLDSPVFVEVLEEGEMLTPLVTDLENIGTRPEDIDASALLTRTVKSSATLRNGLTGGSFVHAQVATYGMTLDCLFSTDDVRDGLSPRTSSRARSGLSDACCRRPEMHLLRQLSNPPPGLQGLISEPEGRWKSP